MPVATMAFHSRAPSRCSDQAVVMRPAADRLDLLERIDPAAAAIVRVLQADQARAHLVVVDRPDLVVELAHVAGRRNRRRWSGR